MTAWTILAYIGVAAIAFAAAFITLVPIGAAKLRNDDADYASALSKLGPEVAAQLQIDVAWERRCEEYADAFPDIWSDADAERVALLEMRLAAHMENATDDELWQIIEETA